MKKILFLPLLSVVILLAACKGKDKESAQSIAQKWCDLNGKYSRAAEGPEKDAAKAARKKYEDDMDAKYEKDKTFHDEIMKEVEKCEAASEGK